MKKLILSMSQIERIFFNQSKRFEVVSKGEWEQDGKYRTCSFIFKDTEADLIYKTYIGKCGSPFTDWMYDSETMCEELYECIPLEEKEVVVKKYVEVDKDKITETETVKEI